MCGEGWVPGEVGSSLSGGQHPWFGLLSTGSPEARTQTGLAGGPSVTSCFESGRPGLTTLPAGSSRTGELGVSVSSKLSPLGAPTASLPGAWGGRRSRGSWSVKTQGAGKATGNLP